MPNDPSVTRRSIDSGESPLHARSRHRERYDFVALTRAEPALARFVVPHPLSGDTVDFANPAAVTTLNRALLKHHYGLEWWDIPPGYLCPPIPGRADYLHYIADLLAEDNDPANLKPAAATAAPAKSRLIPRGPAIRVLDIGVGANCVYPIVGVAEYGWNFVGTDTDATAVESARRIVAANPSLVGKVDVRRQNSETTIFDGVVRAGETFAVSICNPPFHASAQEAAAGTLRKLRNLGGENTGVRGKRRPAPMPKAGNPPAGSRSAPASPASLVLNFGGRANELWCNGGELGFLRRMIAESAARPQLCGWFTTLVSKSGNLPMLEHALRSARATDVRLIPLAAGQKKTRILAWKFSGAA